MAPRPKRRAAACVTLTTDIGWAYAAQMKAVLAHYVPVGKVIDLSHDLPAFRVSEAAFLLRHLAGGFPAGSVHVAVVDPGVGGRRAPVILACRDGSLLVGPDNGLLSPLAEHLGLVAAYRIIPGRVPHARRRSATFDGRDLFAPVAGRLASGASPEEFGVPWTPRRLATRSPRRARDALHGTVVHVDRFGSLITDIPGNWLPRARPRLRLSVGGRTPRTVRRVRTYEELRRGEPGILVSSFGLVEISAREARLSDAWRVGTGASVRLGTPPARRTGGPRP